VRRDRRRGRDGCSVSAYKAEIHRAVCDGGNLDYYTGLPLDWKLISQFNNAQAKAGKSQYLRRFGNLPTVDHAQDAAGKLRFVICSWRVNDAKSHLSEDEFITLCEQVLSFRRKARVRS
jgi:hypothetical protein